MRAECAPAGTSRVLGRNGRGAVPTNWGLACLSRLHGTSRVVAPHGFSAETEEVRPSGHITGSRRGARQHQRFPAQWHNGTNRGRCYCHHRPLAVAVTQSTLYVPSSSIPVPLPRRWCEFGSKTERVCTGPDTRVLRRAASHHGQFGGLLALNTEICHSEKPNPTFNIMHRCLPGPGRNGGGFGD